MSTVAQAIVASLERIPGPLPAVRALHLPPPAADGTRDGEFCAVELEDGSLGLSFVLLGDTLARLRAGDGSVVRPGQPAIELARRYARDTGAAKALGFAGVNALSRHAFDRLGFVPPAAAGSLGDLDLGPGDRLGMVGLFPPLVKQALATGAALTVLELRADLAGEREGWRVTLDPAELAGCNKILSTSTVLLNDTLDELLARCRRAERIALIGPGAGCLPDALFERGVTSLGGTWIVDAEGFKAALREGRSWSTSARKFTLRASEGPFAERLRSAAGSVR